MRILEPIGLTCALALAGACGASATEGSRETTARRAAAAAERTRGLETRVAAQAEEIRELEGRLALARAEVSDLRAALDRARQDRPAVVRIGDAEGQEAWDGDPAAPAGDWEDAPEPEGPRPVLRLYGQRRGGGSDAPPLVLPPRPAHVPERLPVAPLPEDAFEAGGAEAPPEAAEEDPSVRAYRAALALLRDRRFGPAGSALERFLERHPRHPYADDARYWRAFVHYAERDYERALEAFGVLLRLHPESPRVPDALLKMGLCHRRLGDGARARALFQRVRQEFPESVAARMASQEDAS